MFGNPIGHSKSPIIHRCFAEQTAQDMQYEAILAPLEGFADSWRRFVAQGGRGANVTVPFKAEAVSIADVLTERAKLAGAVNTLYLDSKGLVCGDNTDGVGLVTDLNRLGTNLLGSQVLLLGAGGASRGVIGPLLAAGVSHVHIANRTLANAIAVADVFDSRVSASDFQTIPTQSWTVVVNATSSSLTGDKPDISPIHLQSVQIAYDMMYGKEPTAFLHWCNQHGVLCCADGLGMLVAQAAESFFIWRGVRPATDVVLHKLTGMLRT